MEDYFEFDESGKVLMRAKKDCPSHVVIPNTVTEIGGWAFFGCTSLQSVDIPGSVTKIGWMAFEGCTSLQSVDIPASVTEIGSDAFEGCTSLQSVVLPASVTEIGWAAFKGCTSLQSVDLPDSVSLIEGGAFSRCSSLPKISVSRKNSCFVSVDGVLYDIERKRLIQYPAGRNEKAFSIPDTVKMIGGSAFNGCTSLQSVDIPDSVTEIGGVHSMAVRLFRLLSFLIR